MEQLTALPPVVQGVAILIFGLLAVSYLWSLVRKQDMATLRQANKDLRDSLDDQKREIDDKGKEIDLLKDHLKILEAKVDGLQRRNKTIEDIMIMALKEYFRENPEMAVKMQATIGA